MGRQRCILSVLFLSLLVCLCGSTDTITFNQPLKDGDLLISNSSKSFSLGFFTPGNSVGKRYVGVWYQQRVVWVANRDNPVNGTSGVLFIDATGNLVIQDNKTNVSVWNTSISSYPATGIKSYSAQLQDTGNLVLYHDRDRRNTTWQSFDYPTDTILPLMKIGVDKKTGLNRVLTSWKTSDDPGTGQYGLGFELSEPPQEFLYHYKSGTPVWRPGSWNGNGLSGVAKVSHSYAGKLYYTDNDHEVTLMHTVRDPSMYPILVVNESGTLDLLVWQKDGKKWAVLTSSPKDECDGYARCGAFSNCNPYNSGFFECTCLTGFEPRSSREWYFGNGTHGCRRNNTDVCRNGEGFMKLTNWKIPDTHMSRVNRTVGLKECEEICLNNCSCTGYASANVSDGGTGCITWYGDLIDMREFASGGQDMYIRVSASDLERLKKSNGIHGKRLIVIAVLTVAAVVLLLLLCCLVVKMRKGNKQRESNSSIRNQSSHYEHVDDTGSSDLSSFDLKTIQSATDNFSDDNKLGQGGFGSVYKGTLQDGELVAVKRLSRTSGQGIDEFKNEVTLIARLQHRNLVRLLGYCVQEGEKMLVYEYLPNKALDSFIFDSTNGALLDWKKRFEIILGIARGLLYLHQDSRLKIIHRDLKAGNVLLDASMHPKISDFGMARIFGGDQSEANTNRVVGTYGYMSPEYAMEGHFSVKSDVFSFGVLLLEIVTGRKNKTPNNQKSLNLITDVWDFWSENKALDTIDPSLGESYDDRQVLRCIHVGLLCVQAYPEDRPIMSEVIFMLSNEIELPQPNRPGFILKHGNCALPSSSMSLENQSINDMSITNIEGR